MVNVPIANKMENIDTLGIRSTSIASLSIVIARKIVKMNPIINVSGKHLKIDFYYTLFLILHIMIRNYQGLFFLLEQFEVFEIIV